MDIRTGRPIFRNLYGALSEGESSNYFDEFEIGEDIFQGRDDIDTEDWMVISTDHNKATAINYKTGEQVEVPYESYYFY